MSSRKFSFLNSSTSKAETEPVENLTINNIPPILDTKVMEYVISEFKEPTEAISNALTNLKDTLENSIDYIEDKSSELIKGERNFELSGQYRETCIRLHEISESINTYLNWINTGKNLNTPLNYNDFLNKKFPLTNLDNTDTVKNINISNSPNSNNSSNNSSNTDNLKDNTTLENTSKVKSLFIYEDFTGQTPKFFTLKTHKVPVDSWDDMLVQTASILTKNYKNLKESSGKFKNTQKIALKKSLQNDLRDTIIEMLIEHKIQLTEYKVFI